MAGPWEKYQTIDVKDGPWNKYQAPAVDQTSAGQSALEHFGNAASLGYLPQLQAAASQLTPDPNSGVDANLKSQGFNIQQPGSEGGLKGFVNGYLNDRDQNIARQALEGKEHPVASGIGTAAGILSSGLAAGGASSAATLGGRMAQGAKTGALLGALANPGDTAGEISPFQIGDRSLNSTLGAGLGSAGQLAAEGLSAGAAKASSYLIGKAELKAARALGRPTPTQATQMASSGQDAEIGRALLDEGAVPFLGTSSRIGQRVDALKEKIGQSIGDLIKSAGDAKTIDAEGLAIKILDSPELAAMRKTPGMEGSVAAIEKQAETLAKNGTMTLEEAQALRQGIDKSINFNKAAPEMRGAQEGLYQQRTAVRDAMNDAINNINPSAGRDALLKANKSYSNLSKASDIIEREAGRTQANHGISLTDTIAGAAGMAHGEPMVGMALAAINKFGRTFGNSMQARSYESLSKVLTRVPQFAQMAERDPRRFSSLLARVGTALTEGTGGLTPQVAQDSNRGVASDQPIGKANGGVIQGRAKVSGDSKKNDTVPTMLSPGEGIIPRSHMASAEKAHAFIDELFKKAPHMADGGQVPKEGETLGSIIGYPGFPKPKPKGMAHGGVVPKPDPSISKYAKERGVSYEDARRYLMSTKKKGTK